MLPALSLTNCCVRVVMAVQAQIVPITFHYKNLAGVWTIGRRDGGGTGWHRSARGRRGKTGGFGGNATHASVINPLVAGCAYHPAWLEKNSGSWVGGGGQPSWCSTGDKTHQKAAPDQAKTEQPPRVDGFVEQHPGHQKHQGRIKKLQVADQTQ